MTLTIRRTLALLFAAIFIVIAPLSVAYGRGYRFDTKTRHVRLTGVIFLAGWPNRVRISIDEGGGKNVSLPTTVRGLLPTTHTLRLDAEGYMGQTFTLNVRSGQTTFTSDIQLYRAQPFSPVRSGIPPSALLSPDGTLVAWLSGKILTIAEGSNAKNLTVPVGVDAVRWSTDGEDLLLQHGTRTTVAIVSKAGVLRNADYVLPAGSQARINSLLAGRMAYASAQVIPGGAGWLLTDESSAWLLEENGELSVATRWGQEIIRAVHLGRKSIATVRRGEILLRNTTNAQTASYELPGIAQATTGKREGELNLLVTDGDLLQWVRGNFF